MDPHIFADPDPGSQNLADPTDPDPKHWFIRTKINNSIFFCSSSEPEDLNQDGCCGSQETSAEQPPRSKETKSTDECKICYEASVDCVLYVCGHMCLCYEVDFSML